MVTDSLYAPYVDIPYRDFVSKLSPSALLPRAGIRIPVLRELSKSVEWEEIEITRHEDVILKAMALGRRKMDAGRKLEALSSILPFFSSWDQTDSAVPSFRPAEKDKDEYFSYFSSLLGSSHVFTKRFAIVWLMSNRGKYDRERVLSLITAADDESEYYISMAVAWALSLFAFDDEKTLPRLGEVSPVTRKRAEQKIRDSVRKNRISLPRK